MTRALIIAWAIALLACSAPALQKDLSLAEAQEKSGEIELALQTYRRAQSTCMRIRQAHIRRSTCAAAHIHRAELLEDQKRLEQAAQSYEAVPEALDRAPVPSSKALYRAGRLRLRLGQDKRGYTLLWRAVTEFPDVAYAVDALRVLFHDARKRNPTQLYLVLTDLVEPLSGNDVSDNILYDLATLAEQDFSRPDVARGHLDAIISGYRQGGMFDEACWHAARLSRLMHDPAGAAKRLRTLLATREVAMGAGSYFSVWLDNAQLELGIVLRDGLEDNRGAVRAFRTLKKHYPASILHDDATFETAVAWARAGDRAAACKELAHLEATWPDSRYELERGPRLRRELSCAPRKPAEASP